MDIGSRVKYWRSRCGQVLRRHFSTVPPPAPSISWRSVLAKWVEQPSWIVTVLVATWGYHTNRRLQHVQAEHQEKLAKLAEERREEERQAKLGIQQTQILILLSNLRTPIRSSIQHVVNESHYHARRSVALSLGDAEPADDSEVRRNQLASPNDVLEVMDAVEVIETTRRRDLLSDEDSYALFGWMAGAVLNTKFGIKEIATQPKGWQRFIDFSLLVAQYASTDEGLRGSSAARWAARRKFLEKMQSMGDQEREELVRQCEYHLNAIHPDAFAACVIKDQMKHHSTPKV
eukprot:TRINITY_DN13728_c0_g1_i1.p1 TRINITY_DN13728_c0_g1~~TRINITY_DN13728_c0_g1_i1.p1  ORF type:complete len:289 (+),score=44.13 TRINITY_DN13728_c0_g1_i1:32-898(+)